MIHFFKMLFGTKTFLLLVFSLVFVMAAPTSNDLVGGVLPLEGKEIQQAEKDLENSLTKLAAGDGPQYKISKVHSATRQTVAGSLTKMNVDLIDKNNTVKKNCKVTIWSRPWIAADGIEVTFDCEGEEKVVKKHSV